jgi:predicted nuclease of predicted toxin-antitoxin system
MLADLKAVFPGSTQVRLIGLETADDRTIWQYARDHGFAIVTQDSDFHELAALYGAPPKILWFKSGNQPRRYVADALMKYKDQIAALEQDSETTVIEIY